MIRSQFLNVVVYYIIPYGFLAIAIFFWALGALSPPKKRLPRKGTCGTVVSKANNTQGQP